MAEERADGAERPGGGRDTLMWQIVAGILIGLAGGGAVPAAGQAVAFLGDLFLQALKMIVVPLVVLSILVGITGLGDVRRLGRIGWRTMAYYLATTGLAVLTGIVLVVLIRPGVGVDLSGAKATESILAKAAASPADALREMVVGLVPANIIQAAAETEVLPLIVFSLFFGAVLTTFGAQAEPAVKLIGILNDAVMRMVLVIMRFAPVGIGCLVAGRLGKAGGFAGFLPELKALGAYAVTVIVGLVIHGAGTLPLLLGLLGKVSPARYARALSDALLTAFSTASSSATLPLTYECAVVKARVSPRTCGFVLPLGATVNMDGTALYEAVAAIFIAEAYGVPLAGPQYAIIFLTATLAAIGAAGIPEAGLVTMIIVLKAVGLPIEGIGLILAIDWFLDRCRTTINVWGDAVGCAIIDRYENADATAAAVAS